VLDWVPNSEVFGGQCETDHDQKLMVDNGIMDEVR